ncbi:hypothetical protein QZH41_018607, partial [Actinostola sp. cb2023]
VSLTMVRLYYYCDQQYSKIKSQCEREASLFVDSEFPPESRSLFFSRTPGSERIVWQRPKDICAPLEPKLFIDGADSHDVTQGKLGNCWFVAACSSLALRPTLLDKVIPDSKHQEWDSQHPDNYKGIFRFRFYRQGKWTEVVIDDMLPTINGELVYIRSKEKNEFWSALVEKAYAKMAGTYEALEAGNTGDALVDFTGGVGEAINLREGGYANDSEKRVQLFKTMQKGMKDKSLMSASIKISNRNEMEQRLETGLVKGHAYGVTAVKKVRTRSRICSSALLPFCSSALLPFCPSALLPFCPSALLLYSSALLPFCSTLLPFCSTALLLFCSSALLLFCSSALLPFCPSALLPFCPSALLPFCPSALLPFCPSALLPFCPSALLPFCPSALLLYSSALLPFCSTLLPFCPSALLFCPSALLLYSSALLPFCSTALLLFCSSALLLFCSSALLLFCPSALLPFCPSALLPFCPSALLLYSSALLPFCSTALLLFCSSALLLFCSSALLLFCPSALLPFCPSALLPFCPSALLPFCRAPQTSYCFRVLSRTVKKSFPAKTEVLETLSYWPKSQRYHLRLDYGRSRFNVGIVRRIFDSLITVGDGMLSMFNQQHFLMIRLRNPWGQKEWNGAWSDGSDEWNKLKESDRHRMGITFENDGEFWMSFEDFCSHFTNATLCHVINPSIINYVFKQWHVYKHTYQWTPGQNAGGCVQNKESFLKNPQYAFTVKKGDAGQAMVALMQEDRRKDKDKGVTNLTIGFFVMKVEYNRKYRIHTMFDKAGDSIFINAREVMSRLHLTAGRYVVVPSTYEPNVAGSFLLRIYTEKRSGAMFLDQDHSVGSKIFCCLPRCRTPQCIVSISLLGATGLQKGGASLTPDPYATISCEGRKIKTSIEKNTLEPKWNMGALFYVREPQKSQIVIQIWDYNWTIDTFMGQAKIPIKVSNSKTQSTHTLKGRRRQQYAEVPGTITVQISAYTDLFSI